MQTNPSIIIPAIILKFLINILKIDINATQNNPNNPYSGLKNPTTITKV